MTPWGFLLGVGGRAWAYIAAGATVLISLWAAWVKGRRSMRDEVNQQSAATARKMLDAAMQAPSEKSNVVKDLRSGRF